MPFCSAEARATKYRVQRLVLRESVDVHLSDLRRLRLVRGTCSVDSSASRCDQLQRHVGSLSGGTRYLHSKSARAVVVLGEVQKVDA